MARETLAEERESTPGGLFGQQTESIPRVTPAELQARLASDDPPLVLDVRTRSQWLQSDEQIPASLRVPPDQLTIWADRQTEHRSVVLYCT